MGAILETVEKWAAEDWKEPPAFKRNDDGDSGTLKFRHAGECGVLDGYLEVSDPRSLIVMYLYAPSALPEKSLVLAMDAVARINQDMVVGNVEITRNKENWFRFRASIDVEGGSLSTIMLDNLLEIGIGTIERYFPAMLSVCHAGVTPERAIAEARGEKVDGDLIDKAIAEADASELLPAYDVAPSPVLSAWGKELADAISGGADMDTWRMVGRGAVVVHDDLDRACDMLRRVAAEANMRFVRIEREDVMDMPAGAGDPFAKAAPILVYLEPGNWMEKIDDDTGSDKAEGIRKVRKILTSYMKSFDPEHPVIYATSAYKLEDVSTALRKHEMFDRYFHIPKLSPEMLGQEFIALLCEENCDTTITVSPGKVGQLLGDEFDDERLRCLAAMNMGRLVWREKRKLTFLDLVDMVTAGLGESDETPKDNEVAQRHTAIHEAGHAAMAVLDSKGRNTPEYSTIIAHKDSKGMVIESLSYNFANGDLFTYADFRHKIRVSLAGRAAEEVALGFDWICNGSKSDLESCARLASKAFALWGFAPDMSTAEASASNLAAIVGNPTPSEYQHNEMLMHRFLTEEYKATVRALNENRPLLDAIADRLMRDSVLDQAELAELYAAHIGKSNECRQNLVNEQLGSGALNSGSECSGAYQTHNDVEPHAGEEKMSHNQNPSGLATAISATNELLDAKYIAENQLENCQTHLASLLAKPKIPAIKQHLETAADICQANVEMWEKSIKTLQDKIDVCDARIKDILDRL